ncbi:unnamed protein product, partial [Lepidochelys kempii]
IMELSKEPREISDDGIYPVCTFGATGYIDKWLIGEDHIYRYPANKRFDPERVLGTISSVVAFFGLQAGKIILMYHKQPLSVGKRFLIWAVLL